MKTIIRTFDELVNWCKGHGGLIALDSETTSLAYLDLELLGISMSDGTDSCYLVWHGDPRLSPYLSVYLTESVTELIGHNMPYDMAVLYKYGISHTDNVRCTMTAAHICDENGPKKLKVLANTILGIPADQILTWEQAQAFGVNSDKFYQYAVNDAEWTWQLWDHFKRVLRRQELESVYYKIECPFQFVLRDFAVNGIYASRDKIKELLAIVEPKRGELYRKLYDTSGVEYSIQANFWGPDELVSNVNLNNKQVDAAIIQKLGFEITEKTKGGQPSADKFTLKTLAGKHPFIDTLAEYRQYDTLYGNFLKNAESHICADERTRPNVNNCIAVTGRLTYNSPTFQNMPKPGTLPVEYREVVQAPPGYKLVVVDYSGQELRVLAHVSKDKGMIDAFKNNKDLHLSTANRFYKLGIPEEALVVTHADYEHYKTVFKKERNNAKIINFGIAYGKTATGFAADFKIPKAEAEQIVEAYFKSMPGVKQAIEDCSNRLWRQKFVANIAGRRRRFETIDSRAKRQAFNFLIQGASADMMKLAMANTRLELLKYPEWHARIILSVHDEQVIEVKEEYAELVKDLMSEVMCNVFKLVVPLEVDAAIGDTYAECK